MVLRTGAGVVKKQQEGSDVYEYGGSDWTAPGTLPGEREMGFLHFCSLKKRASKPTHAYIVTILTVVLLVQRLQPLLGRV